MLLRKTFRFEASHVLPLHPGKCSNLHGHSWVLHVVVEGPINKETGFVKDYADISAAVKPLIEQLDHKHLGQWALPMATEIYQWHIVASSAMEKMAPKDWDKFLNPTSENLLHYIGKQLKDAGLDWFQLALEETCTSYAELDRLEFENASKS